MLAMTDDRNEISRNALAQAAAAEAKALRKLDEQRDATRCWHLVQIAQQSFGLAKDQLEWAGYKLYAPQVRQMILPKSSSLPLAQRKNRHLFGREKLSPYFGSYRFVRFDPAFDPWHDLFKLVGVHGIGCQGNVPVPLPDWIVDSVRDKEQGGAIPADVPVMAMFYKVGDDARVNSGAFSGFTGEVERVDERGRIRVLLDIFSRLTPVEFTADELDKVTAARPT